MIRAWLLALVVAYLPGAVLFRLPVFDRDRRAQLSAEERVFWHVVISIAWSLAMVLALAGAHAYRFERLLVVNGVISLVAILASPVRLAYRGSAARITWTALLPLFLVGLGVWRFFPVSEYIIGGKDPGTYMNEGIQIAQRGTLVIRDPMVAAVPENLRPLFFPLSTDPTTESNRFMGFPILSLKTGDVVGQFPHLFPASIAVGYGLYGLSGGRFAVAIWATLGLVAVYFTGARFVGRAAAFAAAALLSFNVIELWFGRYPNSEMAMQAMLFATLLAFAHAHQDGDPFFAPVAGVLAGWLIFLRLDGLVVIGCLAGTAVLTWVVIGTRPRLLFVVALVIGVLSGLAYLMGPLRGYFSMPFRYSWNLPNSLLVVSIAVGAVLVAGLFVLGRRFPAYARAAVPLLLTLILVGGAVYACFLRGPLRDPAGKLTDYDALALRTFVEFYLWWPALAGAILGIVLVLRTAFWRDPGFVVVFSVFSLLYFYKIHVAPEHFWMDRRFVPIILPGALLFAAAAALGTTMPAVRSWRFARVVVGAVGLVVLGQQYLTAASPLAHHVEYAGIIPYLEKLSSHFTDKDLVLVEGRDAQSDTHVFAPPLAYIYARNVLILVSPRPDKLQLQAFIEHARQTYARVLFVGGGGTDLLSRRIVAAPIADGDGRVRVPEYANTGWNVYPAETRLKDFDYSIYELTLGQYSHAGFVLDVGERDDLNVLRFHAKERSDGRSIRWTGRQSFVSIPGLIGGEREVQLVMHDGGRPREAPQATVTVFFNEAPLGTLTVGSGFQTYRLSLPADVAQKAGASEDPAQLRLVTTTWNPRALQKGNDNRDLGVMVDRVEVH